MAHLARSDLSPHPQPDKTGEDVMSAFARIAKSVRGHPWWVIAAALMITVGLGFGLLFLKGHVTYQSLLPEDFPSVKALDALRSKFGGISYEYVLVRAPSVTDSALVESIFGLEDAMLKDPRFNSGQVQSTLDSTGARIPVIQDYLTPFIANIKREISNRGLSIPLSMINNALVKQFTGKDFKRLVEEDYLANPMASSQVVGRFITPDRKTALIMIKTGADLTEGQQVKLGADLGEFFRSRLTGVAGASVSISGDATLARDFNSYIKSKTVLLFLVAIIFVILTIFLAFRRFSDTILPIGVMLLGMVWTFGFIGWVGIRYSVAVIAVMPLLLGTALTFVVPFVARYYEEAEDCACAVDAVGKALIAVGIALFLAAITNVFGFLVFQFSVLPPLRDFGLTCAVGTLFVFALSITLLPAIIVVRDRQLESGDARAGEKRKKYFDGLSLRKRRGIFARVTDRALGSFTSLSVRHSTVVIIVFTLLILAGFAQIRSLTTDSDLRKLVPRNLPGIGANFEVEKYFGGNQQDVIMVTGDVLSPESLKAMMRVEDAVALEKGPKGEYLYRRAGVTGLPDALAAANNGVLPSTREEVLRAVKTAEENGGYIVGGLLSADRKAALITLNASGAASTAVVDSKMLALKKGGDEYLSGAGLAYALGGITPLTKDMTKNIIPTETLSSVLSLVLCALILVIIFRSFPYGLITLTVAIAGVAAEIGFLAIVNWPLDIMTSLVSALVIGIGVNFGILFTHRYIQEVGGGEKKPTEAITSTMANLGRANVVAAVATVAAFVIVMFSGIVPLRRFGGVTAVAISACLVASLTLMPALLLRLSGRLESGKEPVPLDAEVEPQVT
jgi:hydrophobe/amphiphile efflux-3 (HAE3) family protein